MRFSRLHMGKIDAVDFIIVGEKADKFLCGCFDVFLVRRSGVAMVQPLWYIFQLEAVVFSFLNLKLQQEQTLK